MLREGRLARPSPLGYEFLKSRVTRDAEEALYRWLLVTIEAARTAVEEPTHIGPGKHVVWFQNSLAHTLTREHHLASSFGLRVNTRLRD